MIARTFYQRGIIETWGRGTLKIARLMEEAGHRPPEVSVRGRAVVVTFRLPEKTQTLEKTLEKTQALEKTTEKTQALEKTTEKTPDEILRLLAAEPDLSVQQLAERLNRSPSAVNRAIRTLRQSGRLIRIGPDKGGHWQVIE